MPATGPASREDRRSGVLGPAMAAASESCSAGTSDIGRRARTAAKGAGAALIGREKPKSEVIVSDFRTLALAARPLDPALSLLLT